MNSAQAAIRFQKEAGNFQSCNRFEFAYCNPVKTYGAIRFTPAMAVGVMPRALTVCDLVEMAHDRSTLLCGPDKIL